MRGEQTRRVGAATAVVGAIVMMGGAGAATASAAPVLFDLFGDATPDTLGLTDVWVFVKIEELGGSTQALGAWQAADAPAGVETLIDLPNRVNGFEIDPASWQLSFAGVYEGGGVALLLPTGSYTVGDDWTDLFAEDEANVQTWLETGQGSLLSNWFNNELAIPGLANDPGVRGDIVNFTTATVNGSGVVNYRIVPAPGAVAALGMAGLAAMRRRRG